MRSVRVDLCPWIFFVGLLEAVALPADVSKLLRSQAGNRDPMGTMLKSHLTVEGNLILAH